MLPARSSRALNRSSTAPQRPVGWHTQGNRRCCIARATKTRVGFKWDAANARWRRDDKKADAVERTGGVMKPLSGPEYTVWPVIHTILSDAKLKSVEPEEAAKLQGRGWTLVDIRLPDQYARQHAEGAVNVPLFRYVQGNSVYDNLKRLAMAGFAMKATERNSDFEAAALSVLKKNQKIIVMCDIGGTLDTVVRFRNKQCKDDPDRAFGRESRSLKACYEFTQVGWNISNIIHLKGGLPQWRYDGFPVEP